MVTPLKRRLRSSLNQPLRALLDASFGTVVAVDIELPWLALTFDDGPDPIWTPRVLDLLAKHDARATFFMIGSHARSHPELVAAVVAAGHAIGHHTLDHVSLPGLDAASRRHQILEGARAIGPSCTNLFRPPRGHLDLPSWWTARRHGHEIIAWSGHAFDWQSASSSVFAQRMRAIFVPGAIVLLHDGSQAPGSAPRDVVLEALDTVLEELGGQIVYATLPALLAAGKARRQVRWRRPPGLAPPGPRATSGSA